MSNTPEQYASYVRDALDKLYNAPLPKTLVNLVLVLDVRGVEELNSGGLVCRILHKKTCPCAAFPTPEQRPILAEYVEQYQNQLTALVDSGRYDGRDDFSVVIQPFMAKTKIPRKANNKVDFSYFAPDCFHFSGTNIKTKQKHSISTKHKFDCLLNIFYR
jgi:phospholipase B1, membrane-associated